LTEVEFQFSRPPEAVSVTSEETVVITKPIVTRPVFIERLPQRVEIQEAMPFQVNAKFKGQPIPAVKWLRNGKPLERTELIRYMSNVSISTTYCKFTSFAYNSPSRACMFHLQAAIGTNIHVILLLSTFQIVHNSKAICILHFFILPFRVRIQSVCFYQLHLQKTPAFIHAVLKIQLVKTVVPFW
jgi:hypothetical protein